MSFLLFTDMATVTVYGNMYAGNKSREKREGKTVAKFIPANFSTLMYLEKLTDSANISFCPVETDFRPQNTNI